MADSQERYTGDPRPLDEQVFETIREARRVISTAEHRYGSYSRNSHEDDLDTASDDLNSDQLMALLEARDIVLDESRAVSTLLERLDAWTAEERFKRLKQLLADAYTSRQEKALISLLHGRQVTVTDKGTRQNPAIVSVRDGKACVEASGFVRKIDVVTGIMGLSSAKDIFELNPAEWVIDVIDLSSDVQLIDLAIHDATE